jgi:prephenate dehydrogenase
VPSTPSAVPFSRVAILGTGLIGGSFGLALRKHFPDISTVGYDRAETLQAAIARGAVREAAQNLAAAVRGADLVYIALPIGATIEALPAIAAVASAGALVTDTGSTKTAICRAAQNAFAGGTRFLGGHPMAGKETSGISRADADLFSGARYALIGSEDDPDPRVRGFAALVRTLGAQAVWCDADTHDWAVGIVSHLPQMLAVALARVVQDETDDTGLPLSLAGPGLQDMLRLAGSPYGLWRDVAHTNTENIARALDRLEQAVEYLRTRLTSKELQQEFLAANELYKQLKKAE